MSVEPLRCRYILCTTLLCSVFSVQGLAQTDSEKAMAEEANGIEQVMNDLMYGSISVSGRVEDISGNLVKGVTAYIDTSGAKGVESKKATVNGSFSFTYKKCLMVALVFECEGYYRSETYDVCFVSDLVSVDRMTGSVKRTVDSVETNIVVVLIPIGKPQDLPTIMDTLTCEGGGVGSVLSLDNTHGSLVTVTNFSNSSLMPNHGMYLTAKTDSAGRIMTDTNSMPLELQVVMTDTNGDGFVRYQARDQDEDEISVSRMMKEAPVAGYARGINVGLVNTYFYFKADKTYGKGRFKRIELMQMAGGSTGVSARVEMYIQGDSTRNLETEY